MKNFKEINIGEIIKERVYELDIGIDRILNTFNVDEKEISQMFLSESLDSNIILKWCKLLEYDFFRIYTQHIILYAPVPTFGTRKVSKSQVPQFRKNLYSKDLIDFAGISKDLVLTSKVNIVEIWDKELYEQSISGDDLDFADLAEEVMGNLNDDFDGIS